MNFLHTKRNCNICNDNICIDCIGQNSGMIKQCGNTTLGWKPFVKYFGKQNYELKSKNWLKNRQFYIYMIENSRFLASSTSGGKLTLSNWSSLFSFLRQKHSYDQSFDLFNNRYEKFPLFWSVLIKITVDSRKKCNDG
jgi:hypothetical protein